MMVRDSRLKVFILFYHNSLPIIINSYQSLKILMQDLFDRVCTDQLSLIDHFLNCQQSKILLNLPSSSLQKYTEDGKAADKLELPNQIEPYFRQALDQSAEIVASFSYSPAYTLHYEESSASADQPQRPTQQPTALNNLKKQNSSKKQKNSNAIKKIGRIILDNLRQYRLTQEQNIPLQFMLKTLSKSSKIGRTQINKRDKFNTHHLSLLFDSKHKKLTSHNLKTTHRILNKYLRRNVLNSGQIDNKNKVIYMNTIKCSSLRCINSSLAVRLQMSL